MRRVGAAWEGAGIVEHVKKRVDGARSAEIQGAMLDGDELWVGLSREKRMRLQEAGRFLMRTRRVHVKSVARWVGKAGYAQFFRPALRCLLQETYKWIDQNRRRGKHRGALPIGPRVETHTP